MTRKTDPIFSMIANQTKEAEKQLDCQLLKNRKLEEELRFTQHRVTSLISMLRNTLNSLKYVEVPHTNWAVLLRKKGEGWEAVECIDTNASREKDFTDFDMILTIPQPCGLQEWEGL